MISVFDKYVLKNLAITTFVTALSLTMLILLTQSIRFLELVISSDASIVYFLLMMGLAVPKFLEATLPLAFAIGIIYTAQKMQSERESVILMAAGASVTKLAKGFFIFTLIMMGIQFCLSGWLSPLAVEKLQLVRQDVKSHYATLMFREGVFNTLGNGMTVYVRERRGLNALENLMIYDGEGRLNDGKKTTLIAKRGIIDLNDDNQQLLVYDGVQYQRDIKTNQISQLNFSQYTLDIPIENNAMGIRWKEPDERIFPSLFINEETSSVRDISKINEFIAEIHRRISTPFLYLAFATLCVMFVFMGRFDRRNPSSPLIKSGIAIITIQGTYLVLYNEARDIPYLNISLYLVSFLPILYGWVTITRRDVLR